MLAFDGNTAPYLQNAHVRVHDTLLACTPEEWDIDLVAFSHGRRSKA